MKTNELFYKLTNIKPYKVLIVKQGITNNNYKVFTKEGIFVLRVPRKDIKGISFVNQEKVLKLVSKLNVEIVYYNKKTGILISKYLNVSKRKKVSFNEAINAMKILHNIKDNNIKKFDPFKLIKLYKDIINENEFINENKIIKQAKKIYKKYPLCLCHNDLLYANFLKTNKKNYLIDYEYAGLNIALFDVVSFLSENNINDENKQKRFIKLYFDYIDNKLFDDAIVMFNLLDLLWYYWAKALYSLYKEQIFLDIANEKKEHLCSRCYNF